MKIVLKSFDNPFPPATVALKGVARYCPLLDRNKTQILVGLKLVDDKINEGPDNLYQLHDKDHNVAKSLDNVSNIKRIRNSKQKKVNRITLINTCFINMLYSE